MRLIAGGALWDANVDLTVLSDRDAAIGSIPAIYSRRGEWSKSLLPIRRPADVIRSVRFAGTHTNSQPE